MCVCACVPSRSLWRRGRPDLLLVGWSVCESLLHGAGTTRCKGGVGTLHHPHWLHPGENASRDRQGMAPGSSLLATPGALGFLGATVPCLALDLGDLRCG